MVKTRLYGRIGSIAVANQTACANAHAPSMFWLVSNSDNETKTCASSRPVVDGDSQRVIISYTAVKNGHVYVSSYHSVNCNLVRRCVTSFPAELMECFKMENAAVMKELRCKKMNESLAAMRIDKHAVDVTLVCGDKEFRAHKLILETSSPYFSKMFTSGMEEPNSGKVKFDSMEPDTLEILLNYIYTGDVTTLKDEQEVIDVLAAAHLMELTDLTDFCFKALAVLISKENCVDMWILSSFYDHKQLKTDVLEYLLLNFRDLRPGKVFLEIDNEQLKEFLKFAVSQEVCLDIILRGVLDWLAHDFSTREEFVSELFECLDPKLFSHPFFRVLLRDKKVMSLSPEISNNMKDLALEIFVFRSETGETKSCDTIRGVIPKFSKLESDWLSPSKVIQNLAWNISIQPRGKQYERRDFGFFIQCNHNSNETNWSCKADVEFKVVNQKDNSKPQVMNLIDSYSGEVSTWGYDDFLDLGDGVNQLEDYLINDTAVFEAKITVLTSPQ